jgi:hypothetical protein
MVTAENAITSAARWPGVVNAANEESELRPEQQADRHRWIAVEMERANPLVVHVQYADTVPERDERAVTERDTVTRTTDLEPKRRTDTCVRRVEPMPESVSTIVQRDRPV